MGIGVGIGTYDNNARDAAKLLEDRSRDFQSVVSLIL